nr:nucleic acid-binding, OB-fold [Tanacetum cinerariifolium]
MYDTALLQFGQSADYRKLWLHLKPESCGNWVKSVGTQDPMYDTALLQFGQSADYRKLWLHLKPESCGNWVKSVGIPANAATTGTSSDGTCKKKGRTVTMTADDMQKRKIDVKARTTLLLSLPDEHQLRFSKNKTAQELWATILKTFGGNEATKKTKKNLLKQQYGIFKAEGSETLEQTFNRLHLIKKSETNSHNMAFISLAKHSRGNEEVKTASVSTASTNFPTASANIKVIDKDDIEEMDIKWNMALLSMR